MGGVSFLVVWGGRGGGLTHLVVVPCAVVDDGLGRAGLPPLATDPVVDVVPADLVGAGRAVVVVDGSAAVGPVRVEVAVVGAGAGLDATGLLDRLEGAGHDGGRGREGREEGGERDHDGGYFLSL